MSDAKLIVDHPERYYDRFDLVKHNNRKRATDYIQVDDVIDDEWDPEMQNGAVLESELDSAAATTTVATTTTVVDATTVV